MSSFAKLSVAALAVLSTAAPAAAQELAGAPQAPAAYSAYGAQGYQSQGYSAQGYQAQSYQAQGYQAQAYRSESYGDRSEPGYAPEAPQPRYARVGRSERRHGGECYAQVRYPASYAPPPTGPEYVWRQAPAPPGAPGPVWCLTVQPFPNQPVQVAPARLGWIRVLCADDVTPERVVRLKRRLHARGFYRGEIDGRYDAGMTEAVSDFQREEHIEHRGYLSYDTVAALDAPAPLPPRVVYVRRPTTFERGYVNWPGKARYW